MSFSVTKRLARKQPVVKLTKTTISVKKDVTTVSKRTDLYTDLYIMPYTEKSFVVMGDTINHSGALVNLGGKYNASLRIGQGWIFAKLRQESVEKYMKTGNVEPYVYSKEVQAKYTQDKQPSVGGVANKTDKQLYRLFTKFREAFDEDEVYTGHSIIEVIYQFEEKYLMNREKDSSDEDEGGNSEEDDGENSEDNDSEEDEQSGVQSNYKRLVQKRE